MAAPLRNVVPNTDANETSKSRKRTARSVTTAAVCVVSDDDDDEGAVVQVRPAQPRAAARTAPSLLRRVAPSPDVVGTSMSSPRGSSSSGGASAAAVVGSPMSPFAVYAASLGRSSTGSTGRTRRLGSGGPPPRLQPVSATPENAAALEAILSASVPSRLDGRSSPPSVVVDDASPPPAAIDVDRLADSPAAVSHSSSSGAAAAAAVPTVAPAATPRPFPLGDLHPYERQPIIPGRPERGWLSRGRLPPHLAAAMPGALQQLLALRPAEHGKVVMFGNVVDVPRYHQAYGRDYSFTGLPHAAIRSYPPILQEVIDWANTQRHLWVDGAGPAAPIPAGSESADDARDGAPGLALPSFNAMLVNWYMNGEHYIGPHSDDERELHPRSAIFSLSLGQIRTFRIREKRGATAGTVGAVVKDVTLRDGDWVVMGGAMQREFKHEVPKVSGARGRAMGARVNITLRMFKR